MPRQTLSPLRPESTLRRAPEGLARAWGVGAPRGMAFGGWSKHLKHPAPYPRGYWAPWLWLRALGKTPQTPCAI